MLILLFFVVKTNSYPTGDINKDGEVSSMDVVMVKRHLLGIEELTKAEQKRADTNKDGVIDIVDLANIQKIILGVD